MVSARDVARGALLVPASPDVPPAVYRGIWKPGAEYPRGSMTTHDGCLWHAESDRVTDRPGKSPGWKLMHKSMEKGKR